MSHIDPQTNSFSHRPATRNGEGRSQTFPLFVPAASAGEEERALSWDTLAGATDPGKCVGAERLSEMRQMAAPTD